MAWLLRTDNTREYVNPANGSAFTLEELRRFVHGYVDILRAAPRLRLVINEEGLLLRLPRNEAATIVASLVKPLKSRRKTGSTHT